MSKKANPRNKRIGQYNPVKRIHSEAEKPEPYCYSKKNNTDTRQICKTCIYREAWSNQHSVCTCMAKSGVPRDKHVANRHCSTYKFGGKKELF